MNRRTELSKRGELLRGICPPKWFKRKCDGCSVPTKVAKKAFLAKMLRAACDIHDADYFCIAIYYKVGSNKCDIARRHADWQFKQNIKTVSKGFGRFRFLGWFLSPLYYWGVRIGGGVAMREPEEKRHKWPVTESEYFDMVAMLDSFAVLSPVVHGTTTRREIMLKRMRKGVVDGM